jgi:hypothetical protein
LNVPNETLRAHPRGPAANAGASENSGHHRITSSDGAAPKSLLRQEIRQILMRGGAMIRQDGFEEYLDILHIKAYM